jgi:hypothetical protein
MHTSDSARVTTSATIALVFALSTFAAATAGAQDAPPAAPAPSAVDGPPQEAPPSPPREAELNLINLGTTRSLDRHQSYFRITHRFSRDLRRGNFGQLLEDFFSLDNGAVIGLEYRFGITDKLQAGVARTALSKTIEFFGRYDGWRQSDQMPVSLSVFSGVEGFDNFHNTYQPNVGATVSRSMNPWLMLYASPTFVGNTRAADTLTGHDHDHDLPGAEEDEHSHHKHTLFVGLGTRVRFRPTAYIVGEYSPRLAGHDPNRAVWGVAVEKATKGHTFQVNFTNAFGTLPGQIARGGSNHDVYLGFNITRKF